MVLGADDVTPLELTSAYATIAAGGVYHPPRVIRRVAERQGQDRGRQRFRVQAKRVVSDGVAYETTQILKQVMTEGTGTHARLDDGRPRPARRARPRTTATPGSAATRPTSPPACGSATAASNKPLEGIEGVGAVYGGTLPAAIWKDFMTTATRRLPPHDWPGAQAADGLQGVQGRRPRSATTRAPAAPPAAPADEAEAEAEEDGPAPRRRCPS